MENGMGIPEQRWVHTSAVNVNVLIHPIFYLIIFVMYLNKSIYHYTTITHVIDFELEFIHIGWYFSQVDSVIEHVILENPGYLVKDETCNYL